MIRENLTNCDKTPIHIPGAVMPIGFLVVVGEDMRVVAVAADTPPSIKKNEPLPPSMQQIASRALQTLNSVEYYEMEIDRMRYELLAHNNGCYTIVEGMLSVERNRGFDAKLTSTIFEAFESKKSWEGLYAAVCDITRELSGFERVMLYKFGDNQAGEVIGESRAENLNSFLNHHFPSSDIPKPARDLYLKNPVRIIPSSSAEPIELEFDGTLDMSLCATRAVAPLHRQYLANMGVEASMSISVIVKGRLWGIIACHHREKVNIPFYQLSFFEMMSKIVSHEISNRLDRDYFELLSQKESRLDISCEGFRHRLLEEDIDRAFERLLQDLREVFEANSVLALIGGNDSLEKNYSFDFEASGNWLFELKRALAGVESEVYWTQELKSDPIGLRLSSSPYAGVISVKVRAHTDITFLFLYYETVNTIIWAGHPAKDDSSGELSPRDSFEAWKQTVEGKSLPFADVTLELAKKLPSKLGELIATTVIASDANKLIAEARGAAMGEMISMIAHQWRQPLTIVGMAVNNLMLDIELGSFEEEQFKKQLSFVESQIAYLSRTIDDFKRFFKPSKEIGDVSIPSLIEQVDSLFSKTLEESDIEFKIHFDAPKEPSLKVRGHEGELLQILIMLLANAQDVLQERKIQNPKIEIEVSANKASSSLDIRVKDNGGGVPEEIKRKIFEPYFSTKNVKNGTGLGLYIAKTIVEKYSGGKLWLENRTDGACFIVRLALSS